MCEALHLWTHLNITLFFRRPVVLPSLKVVSIASAPAPQAPLAPPSCTGPPSSVPKLVMHLISLTISTNQTKHPAASNTKHRTLYLHLRPSSPTSLLRPRSAARQLPVIILSRWFISSLTSQFPAC